MKIQPKIQLIISSVVVLILIGIFLIGMKTFLKKSADTISSRVSFLTTFANMTYQTSGGDLATEQARSTITKVPTLTIETSFRGKIPASVSPEVSVDFRDPPSDQSKGTLSAISTGTNEYQADWTTKTEIDPNNPLDLRISSPGYLSRKLLDISLLNISGIVTTAPLVAGDVNQDQNIDWRDYYLWKASYGQSSVGNPSDFNGDGVVDYKDYAISFGTHCYNASEANQDTQCR